MQPGEGDALKKVTLTSNDGTSYDLIIKGGDKNILETPIGATPNVVGGAGQFGDYDPSFGTLDQTSWVSGWGGRDFVDDEARYRHSTNLFTLTKNKLYLTPQWEQIDTDIHHRSTINLSGHYAGGALDTERTLESLDQYAQPFTPGTSCNILRVTIFGKWTKNTGTQCVLRVKIVNDNAGAPGTTIQGTTQSHSMTFTDVFEEINLFFTSAVALTGSTQYWIIVFIDAIGDGTLQLAKGPDTYGNGQINVAGGGWTGSQDPISFATIHRKGSHRRLKFFYFGGAQFCIDLRKTGTNRLFMMGEAGIATSATGGTIVDTNMGVRGAWSTNQWQGKQIKIVAGTGIGQVRTIASNTNAGSITISGDNWDINPSTDSRYVIIKPEDWYAVPSGTHGLSFVNHVAPAGDVCYFARGESNNIRRMRFNTSASPLQFADDGTNKASVMLATSGRVWRGTSWDGKISYSELKAWGTDLVFTDLAIATPKESDFRGIGLHAAKVHFIKEDSLWFVDAASDILYEFPVNMAYFRQGTNGQAVISNQEYLYFNWGHAIQRLSGLAVENIDVNRDEGLPEDYKGAVTGMAPHPAGIFFSIDGGDDGISSVNVYDGLGFHNVMTTKVKGLRFTDMAWYYVEDDQPILFIASNETIFYQKYPENHTSPLKDDAISFVCQGELETSIIDMGGKSLRKFFKSVSLWGENFENPSDDYNYNSIHVWYNADRTGWYKLGVTTDQVRGESILNFADVSNSSIAGLGNVNEIRFKLFFTDYRIEPFVKTWDEDATTPILLAMTLKGFSRTPLRSVYSFPVDVSAVTERLESGNPDTMMADFWSWAQDAEALYMTSQHPRLHQKTVIIIPRSIRTAYIDRSNETFAADFYMELREV